MGIAVAVVMLRFSGALENPINLTGLNPRQHGALAVISVEPWPFFGGEEGDADESQG